MRKFTKITRTIVVTAAASIVMSLGAPAHAHGTNVPHHQSVQAWCMNGGTIRSYPARDMRSVSGNWETVKWSSDLFKWNGSSWVLVDGSKPWLVARANAYGLGTYSLPNIGLYGTWFRDGNYGGAPVSFLPYTNLTRGYYAVKEYFRWTSTGQTHVHWSTFSNPNGALTDTCRFF
jgi:hypothetical protein